MAAPHSRERDIAAAVLSVTFGLGILLNIVAAWTDDELRWIRLPNGVVFLGALVAWAVLAFRDRRRHRTNGVVGG